MGLDTIAMISWEDGKYVEAPNEWFIGTDLLSRGCMGELNWIRGKVYDKVIKAVSGYTLYDQLNNRTVREISSKLDEYTQTHLANVERRPVLMNCSELKQLNLWFKIAAEKGCFLDAWY